MPLGHQYAPAGGGRYYSLSLCRISGFPRQSKFFRIEPSLPKLRPNFSKKNAWLSFGFRFLPGIEPFQADIATPRAKKPFFAPFSAIRLPRGLLHSANGSSYHIF